MPSKEGNTGDLVLARRVSPRSHPKGFNHHLHPQIGGLLTRRQLGGVQVVAGRGAQVGKGVNFGQEHPNLQGVGAGAVSGELQKELELGLCRWLRLQLGLRLRVALRLWLRLARKAEGESEDNCGRCRGWRLEDPRAGSGSAEGGGIDGS